MFYRKDILEQLGLEVPKTWEEFLKSFGASDYLVKSKYVRQVIFGACGPSKGITAQTKLMTEIACKLHFIF